MGLRTVSPSAPGRVPRPPPHGQTPRRPPPTDGPTDGDRTNTHTHRPTDRISEVRPSKRTAVAAAAAARPPVRRPRPPPQYFSGGPLAIDSHLPPPMPPINYRPSWGGPGGRPTPALIPNWTDDHLLLLPLLNLPCAPVATTQVLRRQRITELSAGDTVSSATAASSSRTVTTFAGCEIESRKSSFDG